MVLNAIGVDMSMSEDYGSAVGFTQYIYDKMNGESALLLNKNFAYDDKKVQELLDDGPKNELYLTEGGAVAFKVTTDGLMQLGLHTPTGPANYSISLVVDGQEYVIYDNQTLKTSVDMFYKLNDKIGDTKTYLVLIKNNGSDILSITDIKITHSSTIVFEEMDQDSIEHMLNYMYNN
jgi:hypothetical protein